MRGERRRASLRACARARARARSNSSAPVVVAEVALCDLAGVPQQHGRGAVSIRERDAAIDELDGPRPLPAFGAETDEVFEHGHALGLELEETLVALVRRGDVVEVERGDLRELLVQSVACAVVDSTSWSAHATRPRAPRDARCARTRSRGPRARADRCLRATPLRRRAPPRRRASRLRARARRRPRGTRRRAPHRARARSER